MLSVHKWQFVYDFLIYFQFPMQIVELLRLSICLTINFNIRLVLLLHLLNLLAKLTGLICEEILYNIILYNEAQIVKFVFVLLLHIP